MCLFILVTAGAVGIGGGAMTLDGALEVVFEDGLPKPIRPKTPATLTLTSMSTSISTQPKEDRDRAGFEKRINEIKQLRGEPYLKPPKPVRSTLKKAYPSNITSNTNMNVPEVMYNPPIKSNDHSIAKVNASSISSATTSAGLGSWSHNTNMEMKSNSSLGSNSPTTTTTSSKKKVTFASILESMRNHPHSISNASKEDRLESQQKLKAETSNWSEVWSQAAKATTTTTTTSTTTSSSPSLSVHTSIKKPPQSVSVIGSVARKDKEDNKVSELSSAKTKKTAKKGIDTGIIVERTPTGPMSEAAIMMKMEPEKSTMDDAAATNAASSSSSSSSHSGDKKESSEDEPSPAELAARSIEGYIQLPDGSSMAVARPGHVRVAPRTLLQGLSYSPFPTATVATVAAVAASSKTGKDEGEQSTDSEVEDEEDTRYSEFEAHVRYCWLGFSRQLTSIVLLLFGS